MKTPPVVAHALEALSGAWAIKLLAICVTLLFVQAARSVLLPVVIAVVLTFVLAPAVRALRRLGVQEMLGAAIVVLGMLGTVAVVVVSLSGPALVWWERAPNDLKRVKASISRLRSAIPLLAAPAPPKTVPGGAAPPPDPVAEKLASEGLAFTRLLLGHVASFLLSAAATVILLYFLLASERWLILRTVQAIKSVRKRMLLLATVRNAQREIAHYFATQGMINAAVGCATGLALWWLDVPNPALWGTVAALLNFIPYIGPMMLVSLLALVGMLSFDDLRPMLAPPLAFLAVHATESNLVSPLVLGRRLQMSPVAIFLSVMLWGWLWGIFGAILAVPLLIAFRSVCRRVRGLRLWCLYLERNGEAKGLHVLLKPPQRIQPKARRVTAARG